MAKWWNHHEVLTEAEEAELGRTIRAWQDGGIDPDAGLAARNRLVTCNFRLVKWTLARMSVTRGKSFEDYYPAGLSGLMHAAKNFDPAKARFATYAIRWIQHAVQLFAMQDRVIHVPAHVLRNDIRSTPGFARLADAGKAVAMVATGMDAEMIAMAARVEDAPNDAADLVGLLLSEVGLSQRQADVIRRRYGLGCTPETQAEIAATYGLTRERVRQIEEVALMRLADAGRARSRLKVAVEDYFGRAI